MNNLNAAEEKLAEASAKSDVSAVIGLQGAIRDAFRPDHLVVQSTFS